jgi:hypothetical protein
MKPGNSVWLSRTNFSEQNLLLLPGNGIRNMLRKFHNFPRGQPMISDKELFLGQARNFLDHQGKHGVVIVHGP